MDGSVAWGVPNGQLLYICICVDICIYKIGGWGIAKHILAVPICICVCVDICICVYVTLVFVLALLNVFALSAFVASEKFAKPGTFNT